MPAYELFTDSTLATLLDLLAKDITRAGYTETGSAVLHLVAKRLRSIGSNAQGEQPVTKTLSCGHNAEHSMLPPTGDACRECERLHQLDEENARRIVCALDSEIFSEWRAAGGRTPRMVDTVYASLVSVVAAKLTEFRRADTHT